MADPLGRTLVIANPLAHSGRGEAAALFAIRFFSSFTSATTSCEVRLTERAGDATSMAAQASGYDTVLALGGDGVIHETVNGLMQLAQDARPCLGLIPMGSGNDFARTLGMSINDAERSIAELFGSTRRRIDLGKVNDTYFMQTLSFGLDAAIALDTIERRNHNAAQSGALLFVTSGLRLIITSLKGWPYRAEIDGRSLESNGVLFAVQNGPTYGGGFRICPAAVPDDGKLDLCVTVRKPSLVHSLALFGRVRFGRHTHSHVLRLQKIRHAEIEFLQDNKPPCQVDGECLEADRYVIDIVPQTLDVLVPKEGGW